MYIIHCKMKGVLPVVMTRNTFFYGLCFWSRCEINFGGAVLFQYIGCDG